MESLMMFDYSQLGVLVVTFPAQGHINPLLQFAKRLASKNLEVTFVTTEASRKSMLQAQATVSGASEKREEVRFETISDGLPADFDRNNNVEIVADMLSKIGEVTLGNLVERLNAEGNRISCIVYDSILAWVPKVTKKFSIPSAIFWTQSCAAFSIYHHFFKQLATGWHETLMTSEVIEISGLPPLRHSDLPSFLLPGNTFQALLRLGVEQFKSLPEATWVLGNSFHEIESEENNSIKSIAPFRTVGPHIPSSFLDGQNPRDTDSGANLWKTINCTEWLNTKESARVVYVSFGSIAVLSKEQIHEIALGLKASGYPFIWVIRPSSSKGEIDNGENLLEGFLKETFDQGLVVPWCPQLEVLSHASVGAFMTHCGWNSTLEGLSCGVPMLALPQWSDQMLNALYVEEKWKTGLRLAKRSEDGLVRREEVERSIRTVMENKRGIELRKNALQWKTLARQALVKGGSSDKNIKEFIEEIAAKASSMSG